jgi:hypothetical protein
MHQHFMVEEPAGSGQNVWAMPVNGIHNHANILVDGGRYGFPLIIRVILDLGMESRKCQRRMGIRTIEVYPKNLHESSVCFDKSTKNLSIFAKNVEISCSAQNSTQCF